MDEEIRILLLEDNPNDAELMQAQLERQGLNCRMKRVDSREGFECEIASRDRCDLILADYNLPSFDGVTALEIVSSKRPGIPFILVSGSMGEDLAVDSLKRGATDYILKDRLERLGPAVERALREARDQREKQRTARALQESEARYRSIFEHTGTAMMIIDEDTTISLVNSIFEKMTGYGREEVEGRMSWQQLIATEEDRQRMLDYHKRRRRGERDVPTQYNCSVTRSDGEVREVVLTVDLLPGNRTSVASMIDVTESRRMERALEESQRSLANLMSNLPGMAYSCSNDSRRSMRFVSEGCRELTGYEPEQLLGNRDISYAEITHPADRENIWEWVQKSLELREPFEIRYRILAADGREKWVWEKGRGIYDDSGGLIEIEGLVMDITLREKAQRQLEFERARLERSLEYERLTSRIAALLNSSDSMHETMGLVLEAMGGKLELDWVCYFSLEDEEEEKPRLVHSWYSRRMSPEPGEEPPEIYGPLGEGLRNEMRASRLLRLDSRGNPFTDQGEPSGTVVGMVLCPVAVAGRTRGLISYGRRGGLDCDETSENFFITTADMVASACERDLNIRARQEADQRRLETVRMAEKATRLASLGTLAAGIAHEINQPLTALKVKVDGSLYLMEYGVDVSADEYRETLQVISQQAARIDDIVNHMRALARQEKGKKAVATNLNNVVSRALSLVDEQLSSHGISLSMDLGEDIPEFYSQPTLIEQVIINLVVNAMYALDESGNRDKRIEVSTTVGGDWARLDVRDSGPGIPEKYIENIFDPFFTTKVVSEGMGLGLSITENIVSGAGGSISAANHPDGGAVFTVLFPITSGEGQGQ